MNALKSGAPTPWLASKFKWSNHAKTLTFTIRKGVKWSDGKPLTAADVLFTFQLLKKHKALDLQAVWSVLKSVSRKGSNKVVFKFKSAAAPYFYYVAGQTPIVPKHVWSKIVEPGQVLGQDPGRERSLHGSREYLQRAAHHLHEEHALLAEGQAEDRHGRLPGLHRQLARERGARDRPGPVGRPVHPEHQDLLHLEEQGQPLLVPAGRERLDLHQPQEPDPQERRRSARDGVRDQPPARRQDRRVTATSLRATRPGSCRPRSRAG